MSDWTEECENCGRRVRILPRQDGSWAYEVHLDGDGNPCGGILRIGVLSDPDEQ